MKKEYSVFSLLLAGSILCSCGCGAGVPRGASISGVEIGGLSFIEAEEKVKNALCSDMIPLTINTPNGAVSFTEELSYSSNIAALVRAAKRGEALIATVERQWLDMEKSLKAVCKACAKESKNATVTFDKTGFTYTAGENGLACDYAQLFKDASAALKEGTTEITLPCTPFEPEVTQAELLEQTVLLSEFTTSFDCSNEARTHNIALACEKFSGTVLESGEEFSFNKRVGARTEDNGFLFANVIFNGEFVPGVGGGVCQVSTTLFNAALKAGLRITESRAHSLRISYVPPSLDAMVSEYSDLKFENAYPYPVYLLANVEENRVHVQIFGKQDGRRYETESVIISRLPPPEPKIVEGEEGVVRAEKEGLKSESYLLVYEGDTLILKTLIRKDTYAAVQGIFQKPKEDEEESPTQNEDFLSEMLEEILIFP